MSEIDKTIFIKLINDFLFNYTLRLSIFKKIDSLLFDDIFSTRSKNSYHC